LLRTISLDGIDRTVTLAGEFSVSDTQYAIVRSFGDQEKSFRSSILIGLLSAGFLAEASGAGMLKVIVGNEYTDRLPGVTSLATYASSGLQKKMGHSIVLALHSNAFNNVCVLIDHIPRF